MVGDDRLLNNFQLILKKRSVVRLDSPLKIPGMRQFYLEYKDHPNLQQLVGEIPWGQNLAILSKVKNPEAKEYYLRGVLEQGWTRNVLLTNTAKGDRLICTSAAQKIRDTVAFAGGDA